MLARETGLCLNVLRYLSGLPAPWTPISAIATRLDLSRAYAGKLCHRLQRAGYLETQQGASGGVRISDTARDASLYDLAEVLRDPFVEPRCLLLREKCMPDDPCPMHDIWSSIHERTLTHFRECRIAGAPGDDAQAAPQA